MHYWLVTSSPNLRPYYTKLGLLLMCLCPPGGPSSGKTTQLENAASRFNLIKLDASKQDLRKEIEKIVSEKTSEGKKNGKKIRVIVEGFPKTLEQSNKFENEVSFTYACFDSAYTLEWLEGNHY